MVGYYVAEDKFLRSKNRKIPVPADVLLAEESELLRLLRAVNRAVEQKELRHALRHADRAWRHFPKNGEIVRLYGQLLLLNDEPQSAVAVLGSALDEADDPDLEAVMLDGLLAVGDIERATGRLTAALARYAVNPGSELALAARRVAQRRAPALSGWIGIGKDLRLWGELVGDAPQPRQWPELRIAAGDWSEIPALSEDDGAGVARFAGATMPRCSNATVTALVGDAPLIGHGIAYLPDFRIDGRAIVKDGMVTGWARLGWAPKQRAHLRVAGSGEQCEPETRPDPTDPRRHLFSFARSDLRHSDRLVISVLQPNGQEAALPDAPLLLDPTRQTIGPVPAKHPANRQSSEPSPRVAVIVPVYKGYDETLACLESVTATAGSMATIVAIDDASPEPDIATALRRLAEEGRITLLRNERNLGFPASVNRGLELDPDCDVVILNADAQVFEGWLHRLRAAAYSAPDIGTVTPLSNSGSIASYPRSETAQPTAGEAEELAHLAATFNQGATVELPTGVGFCLYIKRDCLRQVGGFDAETFHKGYGEENDFCLRASALGWHHVLAADVFVRHHGSRSFGTRREALQERGLRLLDLRYPAYRSSVEAFLAHDPVHPLRRRLDEELLVAKAGRCVLLVTHALPGGVERHVQDRLDALRKAGLGAIVLRPVEDRPNVCMIATDDPNLQDLHYATHGDMASLRSLLSRLLIEHVEVHHFLGLDPQVVETVLSLGRPFDIVIHDFALVCPRIMFHDPRGAYCGMPDLSVCESCIRTHGSLLGEEIDVTALRQRSAKWLASARHVVAPSDDAASRLHRYLPAVPVTVRPWEQVSVVRRERPPRRTEPLRVAIIGAIGERKGYDIVFECAKDAVARDLPIEFVVVGHTMKDDPLFATGKVFVTGRYAETEIDDLIRREDPDIALFPNITPETWCYTLTHALRAGLPVIAYDIGAIAERLARSGAAYRLLPLGTNSVAVNNHLLEFQRELTPIPETPPAVEQDDLLRALLSPPEFQSPDKHVMVADDLASKRVIPAQMSREPVKLSASVESLALDIGLYLFSVRWAAPTRVGGEDGCVLPALHVDPAPGVPASNFSILASPGTSGGWLYHPNDMFVVRIAGDKTMVLITSLRTENMVPLRIEVQRLDAQKPLATADLQAPPRQLSPNAVGAPPQPAARTAAPPNGPGANHAVRLQIVTHVQNKGDILFTGPGWAGVIGQRVAIEAFSIHPLEFVTPEQIEYKAYTATGIETPWMGSGALCGTRGIAVPLVGFAVRFKSADDDAAYACEYSGAFTSGARSGPFANGAPCRAPSPDDRLEAIRVSIVPRAAAHSSVPAAQRSTAHAPVKLAGRRAIGPRFSALRDPVEP